MARIPKSSETLWYAPATAEAIFITDKARKRLGQLLDPVVPGTAPQPVSDNLTADCCIMLTLMCRQNPSLVPQFFALTSRKEKIDFLKTYSQVKSGRA